MITLSIWISMPNLTGGPPYGGMEEYIMLQQEDKKNTVIAAKIFPISDSLNEAHQKSDSCTSKTTAVGAIKGAFFECERRLDFHDAELRNAAPPLDGHVAGGVNRHFPPVVCTAVARIDHAYRIYL